MGITALVIGAAGSVYSADRASSDAEKGRAARKKAEDAAIKREEEAARKLAESTPNKSMNATTRIAQERQYLKRSSGKGRRGSLLASKERGLG